MCIYCHLVYTVLKGHNIAIFPAKYPDYTTSYFLSFCPKIRQKVRKPRQSFLWIKCQTDWEIKNLLNGIWYLKAFFKNLATQANKQATQNKLFKIPLRIQISKSKIETSTSRNVKILFD